MPTQYNRRKSITEFILNHQGCTTEEACQGVYENMARRTFFDELGHLKEQGVVTVKKKKPNGREHLLFIESMNPMVLIPKELEEFKDAFFKLLNQSYQLLVPPGSPPEDYFHNRKLFVYIMCYLAPHYIISYLIRIYNIKFIFVWPHTITDRDTIGKMMSLVFAQISEILSVISNRPDLKSWRQNLKENEVDFSPDILNEFEFYRLIDTCGLLYGSLMKVFKNNGCTNPFENVMEKLWIINSDVESYTCPQPRKYNLHYEYGKEPWTKYRDIISKNKKIIDETDRTRHKEIEKRLNREIEKLTKILKTDSGHFDSSISSS